MLDWRKVGFISEKWVNGDTLQIYRIADGWVFRAFDLLSNQIGWTVSATPKTQDDAQRAAEEWFAEYKRGGR